MDSHGMMFRIMVFIILVDVAGVAFAEERTFMQTMMNAESFQQMPFTAGFLVSILSEKEERDEVRAWSC